MILEQERQACSWVVFLREIGHEEYHFLLGVHPLHWACGLRDSPLFLPLFLCGYYYIQGEEGRI
jgi:hypothetical protein